MADTNKQSSSALNGIGGAAGLVGSWIGAYASAPKRKSVKPYFSKLRQAGDYQYQAGSMDSLMEQRQNQPYPQALSAEDLYNPSFGETFASMFGAEMGSYGAAKSLTDGLTGTMGTFGGKPMTVDTGAPYVQYHPDDTYVIQACGGPLHKFADGGEFAGFDKGAMLGAGLNMLSGFVGVGLNAAAQARQKALAEAEADMYNANRAFVNDRQNHNFALAINDTKDNMFNNQALQMMAFGGDLSTQGADFPLDGNYNFIGTGGSHEQNPLMGVPQGLSSDGQPNLVEEGEVVWNDYVFSKRLTVPEKFRKEHKLKEGATFADAAEFLSEEAKERPNDPISQNGIEAALSALQSTQEDVRMRQQARQMRAAIKKMSPEELVHLQQMLAQGTPEEGMDEQEQMFAKGGKKSEMTADQKRALLAQRWLSQINGNPQLLELVKALGLNYTPMEEGVYKDADIRDFLLGNNRTMDDLKNAYAKATALKQTNDDYYKYDTRGTGKDAAFIDRFNTFMGVMDDYTNSLIQGRKNSYYRPDASQNAADIEKDPAYQVFKEAMWRAAQGEDMSKFTDERFANYKELKAEQALQYLKKLDERNWTKDSKAPIGGPEDLFDANGNLKSNAKAIYDKLSYDRLGGIYHLYDDFATNGKQVSERTVYLDKDMNLVEVSDPSQISKFMSQTRLDDIVDEQGRITHRIQLTSSDPTHPTLSNDVSEDEIPILPTIPRYAPVLGSAIGALQSLTEEPRDYSVSYQPKQATYQPIGNYLKYNPVDSQRYLNAEQQRFAAQMAAIQNATGANKNVAMAQAAVANQGHQANVANILNSAEALNFSRRAQVGEFNRGTDQSNASAFDALSQFNAGQWNGVMPSILQEDTRKRMAVDTAMDDAKGTNLNNLFNNIGNIGSENLAYNMANDNPALYQQMLLNGTLNYKGKSAAKGGMLTKKNRRK